MFCYRLWMDFQDIIRLRWLQKIWRKPPLLHHGGHIATRLCHLNAGATYQRAATTLLLDLIHKEVEVYVDDMIVKSKDHEEHMPALRKFFERIRLNPKKCTFGVPSGKLLGFIVSQRGIEVNPDKIKAIVEMKPPRIEKEIQGFLGRIQYDITLAVLYMRNRHYWEDSPSSIQWPWIHTRSRWLFHQRSRSRFIQSIEFKESCSIYSDQYHLQIRGTTWNYLK